MIEGLEREKDSDMNSPNKSNSILKGSVFEEYTAFGINDNFDKAKEAFAAEVSELLCLEPIDSDFLYKRSEPMRGSIVKVLLYIGATKADKMGLLARLVEKVALDDEFKVETHIKETAELCGVTVSSVERLVEKAFNVYDAAVLKKISALTKTSPLTSRDALCDIALYVRTKAYGGGLPDSK